MTPSRSHSFGLEVAVSLSLILIFSLIFLSFISEGLKSSEVSTETRKMVLGSRPPGCINKCMSCHPCEATLVIPHHQKKSSYREAAHRENDSYYLLSWKCKCGNKFFQP